MGLRQWTRALAQIGRKNPESPPLTLIRDPRAYLRARAVINVCCQPRPFRVRAAP